MATFRKAEPEVNDMVKELVEAHHRELHECKVTFNILLAYPPKGQDGSPQGPALRFAGVPVVTRVKVNSHQQRVAGLRDATLSLDGDAWEDLSEDQQRARLDGMLARLEVVKDEEGNVKLDDCHRPKLRLKAPDWLVMGCAAVAQRHGEASDEVREARKLADEYGQLLFPWARKTGAA